jgi:hypothetical protein
MKSKAVRMFFVSIVVAALVAGCARTKQARGLEQEQGFIVDYSMLEKGGEDQALLRYQNPDADVNSYTKIMLDPVLISTPENASEQQMADFQRLATNFYVYLVRELEKDYMLVNAPEPGTMRIQAAVTGARKSGRVSNAVSSVMPIGIAVSVTKDFVTGKPTGVGEAATEMKITDAMTGELLGAAVDRRVGGKRIQGVVDTWYEADGAVEFWAKRLSYILCKERGDIDCEKP